MSATGSGHPSPEESVLLSAIRDHLQRGGAAVELAYAVRGRSGANHVFDLVATKGDSRIFFDVRVSDGGDVELKDVLETYAKSLDGRSKPAVLVVVPGASSDARRGAAAFGIFLLEARDKGEVLGKLDSIVSHVANP